MTDVLYRDPQGNVGVLKSGREDEVPLTTSPVPMKDMRFGDFDGDRKTDIFVTHYQGQWRIWRGASKTAVGSRQQARAGRSQASVQRFDGVPGTDVATVLPERPLGRRIERRRNRLGISSIKRFAATFKNAIARLSSWARGRTVPRPFRGVLADGTRQPGRAGGDLRFLQACTHVSRDYGLVGRFRQSRHLVR